MTALPQEAMLLLGELVQIDVHYYEDNQDVLQCILCGYQHRLFDAEPAVMQKQHHVECLLVRARLLLSRWRRAASNEE